MSSTLPTHPRTGLHAIGFRKDGRAIWPIMGAEDAPPPADVPPSDSPPADPPPANGGDPTGGASGQSKSGATPPVDDKGFPEGTPVAEMTAEQQAAYWKHQARKHEERARSRADYDDVKKKAAEYDKYVESQKTEAQRLADAKTAAEKLASDTAAELALTKAALKHGLSEDDLELLADVPADQVADRAERLAKRLKSQKTTADFGGGHRGGDVVNGVKQWKKSDLEGKTPAEIEAARRGGQLDQLMGKPK